MAIISRLSDIGVGRCCHPSHNGCVQMTGQIITSCVTTQVENELVARIGDIVQGVCGHTGIIISGSETLIVENNGVARVGDQFVGDFSGTLVTGAASYDVGV